MEEGYDFGSGFDYSYYKCLGEDRCRSTRRPESPFSATGRESKANSPSHRLLYSAWHH